MGSSGSIGEKANGTIAGFTYCAIAAAQLLSQLRLPRSAKPQPKTASVSDGKCLSNPDLTVRWLLSRLTTFVEEKEEEADDGDTEPDGGMSDDDALSTATDVMQTPDTSFPNSSSGAEADGGLHESVPAEDHHASHDEGPAQAEEVPSFKKMRSYPAPPLYGDVDNPTAAPPQLAASENLIHAATPPPPETADPAGQQQWAGFNGRPNKLADTCYVFWVGSSLQVRIGFPQPIARSGYHEVKGLTYYRRCSAPFT